MDMRRIREDMKCSLKPSRYEHTKGVARTAREMARRFGANPDKAELAGWIHDCAKDLPHGDYAAFAREKGLDRDPVYRLEPELLHGSLGAKLARERWGITDGEVLRAVSHHTIPELMMDALDMVLFTADMIEPSRKPFPGLETLRALAERDLDLLYGEALRVTLLYTLGKGKPVHPDTLTAYNAWLLRRLEVDRALC